MKEDKKNRNLILVVPNQKYRESIVLMLKRVSEKYEKICYIGLNETYFNILKTMKENQIDEKKFIFIDTVSKKSKERPENCFFVSAPNSLIELSIAVSDAIQKFKPNLFVLDSASTMLIYEEDNAVIRFIHAIMEKIEESSADFIITILYSDEKNQAIEEMGMFVDEFIDVARF